MEHLSDRFASHGESAVKDFQAAGHNTVQTITASDSARVHNGHNINKTFISRSYTLERNNILNWLSTLSFIKAHESVRDGALLHGRSQASSQTRYMGKWLLESQAFVNWATGNNDKLWYLGMPGVGKSVLASIIIERLCLRSSQQRLKARYFKDPSEQVAYLYLGYIETQSTESLLGSVIRQLVQYGEMTPQTVRDLWLQRDRGNEPPTLRDLTDLLETIHRDLEKPNYVVVDALDECPASIRTRLIQALQPECGNLKILVTSRHMDEFEDLQAGFGIEVIKAHQDDLDLFMENEMHRDQVRRPIWENEPALRDSVKSAVKKNCDGMFLLASLQMRYIVSALRKSDVLEKLKRLPTDVDELLYQKTFDRIEQLDEEQKNLALDILKWIVFSCRPLSIEELRHALAVKPGQSNFDVERLYNADVICGICSGLVSVRKKRVVFTHYTAHTFFSRLLMSKFPEFHSTVCLTLVTYLSLNLFEQSDNIDDCVGNAEDLMPNQRMKSMSDLHVLGYLDGQKQLGFDAKLRWFPLLRYAADYLSYHLRQENDPVLRVAVVNALEILLRSEPKRRFLVRLIIHPPKHLRGPRRSSSSRANFRDDHDSNYCDPDASSSLSRDNGDHAAGWLEQIPNDDSSNKENRHNFSPPTSQSASDDVPVTIHPRSDQSNRELTRAPSHTSVIAGGIGGLVTASHTTALHVACYLGWKPLVDCLLEPSEFRSEMNQLNEDGITPASYAVKGAFWDIVSVLIARGQAIDLATEEGHAILMHAARINQKYIIQRVLSQELQEIRTISGWAMALEAGRTRLRHLRRSIRNYLKPSHISYQEETAAVALATRAHHLRLLLAALNGDMTQVRQSLAKGLVDLKYESSHFHKTALFLAVEFGHVNVVTELLDGGANVDTRGIDGCTPLHRATARDDAQMVRALLDKGASIIERDDHGETAWLAHAYREHAEVLYIPQRFDTEPSTMGTDGMTEIYTAAAGGHLSTVISLLNRGANPSVLTDFGWAPLHWASYNGHTDCVQVLLEHGANPSPISDQSTTPLDMARQSGQHAIAKMLLAAGAKTAQEVLQSRTKKSSLI